MYRPELETVPPVADHVTDLLVVPETVGVNCWVLLMEMLADVGVMVMLTPDDVELAYSLTLHDPDQIGPVTHVAGRVVSVVL